MIKNRFTRFDKLDVNPGRTRIGKSQFCQTVGCGFQIKNPKEDKLYKVVVGKIFISTSESGTTKTTKETRMLCKPCRDKYRKNI